MLLLESICLLEGIPQHLHYHEQRMNRARAELLHEKTLLSLQTFPEPPPEYRHGQVKCRILYRHQVEQIEWSHYTPKTIRSLQPVQADSLDYAHKYADRSTLEMLLQQRGSADDILIIRHNRITDTSYCNVAFRNGAGWITPAEPLLPGTCRQRLIDTGVLEPADIRLAELRHFTEIYLFNAMLPLGSLLVRL
jgi:4-amino-4-deoxychorismate lyase